MRYEIFLKDADISSIRGKPLCVKLQDGTVKEIGKMLGVSKAGKVIIDIPDKYLNFFRKRSRIILPPSLSGFKT